MVKRVSAQSTNPHNVVSHYTYFKWCNCLNCEQDFRRENGVMWTVDSYANTDVFYLCADCCHNGSISWTNQYIDWREDMRRYEMRKQRPPVGR